MFCHECGQETVSGGKFCTSCGTPLASQKMDAPSVKQTKTSGFNADHCDALSMGKTVLQFSEESPLFSVEKPPQFLWWAYKKVRRTFTTRGVIITPASYSERLASNIDAIGSVSSVAGAIGLIVRPTAALVSSAISLMNRESVDPEHLGTLFKARSLIYAPGEELKAYAYTIKEPGWFGKKVVYVYVCGKFRFDGGTLDAFFRLSILANSKEKYFESIRSSGIEITDDRTERDEEAFYALEKPFPQGSHLHYSMD